MCTHNFVKLSKVVARDDYTLLLSFENGEQRTYDFKPLLKETIFAPLKDLSLFLTAQNKTYGVVWNDAVDIASEELFYNGQVVR